MKHLNAKREYIDLVEFIKNEPEAVKSLITSMGYEGDTLRTYEWLWDGNTSNRVDRDMEDIQDLVGFIQEAGSSEERVTYDYIYNDYSFDTHDGKFTFEVYGSSYRKDQCICDEEVDDLVVVIDKKAHKIQKM